MRMALLQQMRPQVRAELEAALRLEIRTSHAAEIRKEVEAAVVADVEKRVRDLGETLQYFHMLDLYHAHYVIRSLQT